MPVYIYDMEDESNEIKRIFRATEAFVAYSLPGESDYYLVFQDDRAYTTLFDGQSSAFVVDSFSKTTDSLRAIRADHVMQNTPFQFELTESIDISSTSYSDYMSDVTKIISDIRSGEYDKLVYSKIKKVAQERTDIFALFEQLLTSRMSAFVFCYHIPGSGLWMGATPEVLLSKGDGYYHTMALAGTQYDSGVPVSQTVWGEKEIAEQAFLKDFVKNKLAIANLSYEESEDYTLVAGPVRHIATDYHISTDGVDFMRLAQLLHPGPAISGMPQGAAMKKIKKYERHDRQDYTGYLGPVGINGAQRLFINLRSMQLSRDAAILYLGGGITADSDPAAEWEETEDKASTLLSILQHCPANS